jgi:hypothetical protein
MTIITVSSENRLYLTQAESSRLAEHIRHELICRTTAQADEPVMVADVLLTSAEAWRLLDRLDNLVTEETIDWQTEGF